MAASINASTSAGVVTTADTSGNLNLQSNGTTIIGYTSAGATVTGTLSSSGQTILGSSSGNVGVGVTPSAWSVGKAVELGYSGTALFPTGSTDINLGQNAYYNGGFKYGQTGVASGRYVIDTGAHYWQYAASGTAGNTISWTTGMTLSAAGLFANNCTVAGNRTLFTNSASTTPYGLAVGYSAAAPNGTDNDFWYAYDSSTLRGRLASNGGIYNYSANNSNLSDISTKKNIALAGSYLGKITAIPVKTFLYKDQTDSELNLGVIAQDVFAVAPELVNQDGFGSEAEGEPKLLSIYQTDLQYALMKCIQEQQTLIESLTARIAALEAK